MNKHNERAELAAFLKTLVAARKREGSMPPRVPIATLEKIAALMEAQHAEQAKGQEAVAWVTDKYSADGKKEIDFYEKDIEPLPNGTKLYTTPPAQPAREWVGLTDVEIEKGRAQTFSINNPFCPCDSKTMRKAARWAESKLREKNAGLPAADDKAGGEPVTGRDLFVAWWDGYGMQPGVECSLPVWKYQETAIQSSWNHVATRYYTPTPQPQAEVRVPDGWHFSSADFSMQACGKSAVGSVMLIRDMEGQKAWHALSDEDKESVELYVSGKGATVLDAVADASSNAMLAAAPKPQDDLPAILKKQTS